MYLIEKIVESGSIPQTILNGNAWCKGGSIPQVIVVEKRLCRNTQPFLFFFENNA